MTSTPPAGPAHRTRRWHGAKLVEEGFPIEQVSDYREDPDCLVWADVCAPDEQALAVVADELDIDPHAVEDAVGQFERPKLLRYPNFVFISTEALHFDNETGRVTSTRVSAFVLPNCLVTIRESPRFDIDDVVARWDDESQILEHGSLALIHGLLDSIVDGHVSVLEALDAAGEDLETLLFEHSGLAKDSQRRAFTLRRSLLDARRAVVPMRDVVAPLVRKTFGDADPVLAPYYQDLYDHVQRAIEWTDSLRDLLSTVFETNLTMADERMNMIMKKVTSWAAIIAVPTLVTGFYGQNVPYPGFATHVGFWVSTIVMIVAVVALYVIFKRKDWL